MRRHVPTWSSSERERKKKKYYIWVGEAQRKPPATSPTGRFQQVFNLVQNSPIPWLFQRWDSLTSTHHLSYTPCLVHPRNVGRDQHVPWSVIESKPNKTQSLYIVLVTSFQVTHVAPFVHVLSRLSKSVGQLQNEQKNPPTPVELRGRGRMLSTSGVRRGCWQMTAWGICNRLYLPYPSTAGLGDTLPSENRRKNLAKVWNALVCFLPEVKNKAM